MATEGNLEAPTRHPIDWKNPDMYERAERVNKPMRLAIALPLLSLFLILPCKVLSASLPSSTQ